MDVNLINMCLAIGLVTLIVYQLRRQLSYWKRRGIPQLEPLFFYGNFKGVGKTRHISEPLTEAYRAFKGKTPFVGIYMMLRPAAVVTDLDLVKNILIKDFQNFTDRGGYSNERDDPLSGNLFHLDGSKWRKLRHKLTPTFTSGKMKFMFPTILKVAHEFIESLETLQQGNCNVGMREILNRFTTDVIGTCAFGIECNSLKDPNTQFMLMGRKALFTKNHGAVVDNFMTIFPKVAAFLRMRRVSLDVHNFFMSLVRETLEYREKNNIERNDFFNLLIGLKNKKSQNGDELQGFSVEAIAAQLYAFFLAGFETSSSTMGFCLYELALNENIQDRLRQETIQCLDKYGNELTYDSVKDMKYLQMVTYETLRKYPVIPFLTRIAFNDYSVDGSKFIIEKGTKVVIPTFAIQHDPEVYPNPDVFDPERFSTEQVEGRHPMAWLSFGDGPRNCIGLRFGKMQTSIGLALLLKHFRFSICSQTDIPLKFGKKNILLYHDNEIVLKVEKV